MTDTLICAVAGSGNMIRGSILSACSECGQKIEVAPSGQEIAAHENVVLLCTPCGLAAIKADPTPEIVPITEAQKAEIRRHRSDDA